MCYNALYRERDKMTGAEADRLEEEILGRWRTHSPADRALALSVGEQISLITAARINEVAKALDDLTMVIANSKATQ